MLERLGFSTFEKRAQLCAGPVGLPGPGQRREGQRQQQDDHQRGPLAVQL